MEDHVRGLRRLEGDRVFLRSPRTEDLSVLLPIFQDPMTTEYVRHLTDNPEGWSREAIQDYLARCVARDRAEEAVHFVAVRRKTGRVVGMLSVDPIDLQSRTGNFSLIVDHTLWRSGIGTECCWLGFEYVFTWKDLQKLAFIVHQHNPRGRGFLERLGLNAIQSGSKTIPGEKKSQAYFSYILTRGGWPDVKEKFIERLKKQRVETTLRT